MAEAILNHLACGRVRAMSAAGDPSGGIHPYASECLAAHPPMADFRPARLHHLSGDLAREIRVYPLPHVPARSRKSRS